MEIKNLSAIKEILSDNAEIGTLIKVTKESKNRFLAIL
jgi:hypothetical protein